MKLITRELLAKDVAKQWKWQYYISHNNSWMITHKGDSQIIYNKLVALGDNPNPNPDDVDKIIGNKTWTTVPRCNECNAKPNVIIFLGGDNPDHWENESTLHICKFCLEKALHTIRENPSNG